jgi:hypothetical protein
MSVGRQRDPAASSSSGSRALQVGVEELRQSCIFSWKAISMRLTPDLPSPQVPERLLGRRGVVVVEFTVMSRIQAKSPLATRCSPRLDGE